ncbi:MAG: HAMP domain-containing protein [Candidatus Eisenbacteria bacterium]|nr:HAMP domain-containing protein [Candidatus Eisenbacteria bacterium]
MNFSLKTRVAFAIVVVVLAMGVVSTVVGTWLFADSLVTQVQRSVEQDLNTAYLVYEYRLDEIEDEVERTASDPEVVAALAGGSRRDLHAALGSAMETTPLDLLTVTDAQGFVVARGGADEVGRQDGRPDQLVGRVLKRRSPVSGTIIMSAEDLGLEAPELEERARMGVLETPRARPSDIQVLDEGMVMAACAPVLVDGRLVGAVYGGSLLNGREDIVDRVKETAYAGETWKGKDIGTATIFQDDVRIATNVKADGRRAVGTRVSEEVYDRVVGQGKRWIARAFVVDDWYITAYGPIRDLSDKTIGILYVGLLAGKFDALRTQTIWTFAGVSVAGMVIALIAASMLSSGILRPVRELAEASHRIAEGDMHTQVDVDPAAAGEFKELAQTFNTMAQSIAERDRQLQENARKMTETKKLATLGQLAAGIAHEINNPLGGILMYSHILKEELRRPENRETVEKIAKESDRCKKIVKGLLDFARQTKPERTESNLNHVIDEVIALLEHQAIFHNIDIEKEHSPGLPLVDVDVAQMQEVFMNIILNAAQAMQGKGKLTTVTRITRDNKAVEVEIRDTGSGIPAEDLDKIFEPFYTTKEVGRGTGLGLAIAYGIVERHHGSIWVESEQDKGTSFFIRLPIPEIPPEM